jgi:hypothetical protein
MGVLPAIRRGVFEALGTAGVVIRAGASLPADATQMGYGLNGWNNFTAVAPGLAVINESSAMVDAQWNEWGSTSASAIAAMTQGDLNVQTALDAGEAEMGGGLQLVLWTASSPNRVAQATVSLTGATGTSTGTTDGDGRLSWPVLPVGTYEVRAAHAGHQTLSTEIEVESGGLTVANLSLTPNGSPNGGDDTPEKPMSCSPATAAGGFLGGRVGDLALGLLLLGLLLLVHRRRGDVG